MFKTLHILPENSFCNVNTTSKSLFGILYSQSFDRHQSWLIVTQCATQLWDLPTCNVSFVIGLMYIIN